MVQVQNGTFQNSIFAQLHVTKWYIAKQCSVTKWHVVQNATFNGTVAKKVLVKKQ
jgi:hypothetical protein